MLDSASEACMFALKCFSSGVLGLWEPKAYVRSDHDSGLLKKPPAWTGVFSFIQRLSSCSNVVAQSARDFAFFPQPLKPSRESSKPHGAKRNIVYLLATIE